MSLINDALRRANQGKKEPEKSDGAPMQPVHAPTRDRASFLGPILLTLIVLVLMMAAFLFWKGMQTKKELAAADKKLIAPPRVAPTVPAEPKPLVQAAPAIPAPPIIATNGSTNSIVTNLTVATNPAPPPVDPGPPPLKLQGIFYRPSNPTAMINGKTVGIGELVSGARVLKIDRQEVTLERAGKLEILTLE